MEHTTHINTGTQSGLKKYIDAKILAANKNGLSYNPILQGVEQVVATYSHLHVSGTQSFTKHKNGFIRDNATYSNANEKPWFIGTHSHNFESKGITLSHSFNYNKQAPIQYISFTYSGHMGFTQSNIFYKNAHKEILPVNAMMFTYSNKSLNAINHIDSIKGITHSMNKKVFASTFETKVSGVTSSTANSMKKFYAQPTAKTKKMVAATFSYFISKIINNAEQMINNNNVTVNGNIVTATYSLKTGDIVRIGNAGHYINNSDLMVIVN